MRPLKVLLSKTELQNIYTNEYWNSIEEEKKKEWWIVDGNYEECIKSLHDNGSIKEFEMARKESGLLDGKEGLKVLDVAAGVAWTSAVLTNQKNIAEVHAIEISKHRIGELTEHAFKMFPSDDSKFFRYLGSFYDNKQPDDYFDYIIISKAFHHANQPLHLLLECDRVLKNGGKIIIVGEHPASYWMIFKKFLSLIIKKRRFSTNFYEFMTPNRILGDHFFRVSDYHFMFNSMGYSLTKTDLPEFGNVYFIGTKHSELGKL
ncbi:MAG: class I SAM-dependent methyltransferase [Magnetococcales bacterium]|nr:class I SAM-dependent methyltransferase [Magnetococcales bacterium]